MISSHLESFAGYAVKSWGIGDKLENLEKTIYRIAVDYDDDITWADKFNAYLAQPHAEQTRGIVLGMYSDEMFEESSASILELLINAKDKLPLLDTIFVNDVISEENEISWIINADNAPLIHAFPKLKHFGTRGGNELSFNNLNAPLLETLIVQSGGLDSSTIIDITNANLPNLKHLEIYLGTDDYGFSGSVNDLAPILQDRFNQLTYLGLKNCEIQDDIAIAVANAPVTAHLKTLDLSLGVLTDKGGQALLESTKLNNLMFLDLNYNYFSENMAEQLEAFAKSKGFKIDVSSDADYDEDDDWRYVCIGE